MFAQQTLNIDVSVFGLNVNQTRGLTQLDEACDAVTGNGSDQALALLDVCATVDALDPNDPDDVEALAEIADIIAPEEAFAINDSLTTLSDYQTTNVRARLNALRSRELEAESEEDLSTGIDDTALAAEHEYSSVSPAKGGGASADLSSRFGSFVSGHISSGDIDGAKLQQSAEISSSSITIGGDYRFNDNVVAGLGIGFLQDESSFKRFSGGAESEAISVTAFATWYETDKGYLDIVLDIGSSDYELERSISIPPDTGLVAVASPGADSLAVTLGAGRNFQIGGWDLGGYFRLSHKQATVDAYSESLKVQLPGFATLYSFDEQEVQSTETVLGVEVSKVVNTTRAVFIPLVRVEYVSENEREKDEITATLISTNTVASYRGEDRVGSYSNFGIGANAVFRRGKSAYAYYETHIQHDLVSQDWLKAGIRFEF
ncbi:MAG: autotransporter outer membrane beta-barrel domain-containing protein [Granulosicoccus sp.]